MSREIVAALSIERMVQEHTIELRVSKASQAESLAVAISRFFEEGKRVTLSCIGKETLMVAMRAIGLANGDEAQRGRFLGAIPTFEVKSFSDRETGAPVERDSIKLVVTRIPIVG